MKNLIKSVTFILIFLILLFLTFKIFWLEKNPITYFYKEPKNTLDIIYIGSSNAFAHFNTTLAYEEYGFTTGMLSYNAQPFAATEYLIKESKKYQNPNLYIIDIQKSASDFSQMEESDIRRVTDSMKNSQNRSDTIDALLNYANIPKEQYVNYYYSFLKYHEAWKSPRSIYINIFGNKELYKGYLFSKETIVRHPIKEYEWKNEIVNLDKENIVVLENLLNYIKKENLNVLFVVPKRFYEDEKICKLNHSISIIKENGFNVVNFNTLDDFEVDFENDFYNEQHLNVWGATKYTLYFSKYLKENYDNLGYHKNDKCYLSWNEEYKRFKQKFNKLIGKDFNELLKEYKQQSVENKIN